MTRHFLWPEESAFPRGRAPIYANSLEGLLRHGMARWEFETEPSTHAGSLIELDFTCAKSGSYTTALPARTGTNPAGLCLRPGRELRVRSCGRHGQNEHRSRWRRIGGERPGRRQPADQLLGRPTARAHAGEHTDADDYADSNAEAPTGDTNGWDRNRVFNIFDILALTNRFGPGTKLSEQDVFLEAPTPPG